MNRLSKQVSTMKLVKFAELQKIIKYLLVARIPALQHIYNVPGALSDLTNCWSKLILR